MPPKKTTAPLKTTKKAAPKLKLVAPKKKAATKPKGKTIKGDITEEPEMPKDEDEEEPVEEPKKTVKKTKKTLKKVEPVKETLVSDATVEKAINALSTYLENRPKLESGKESLFEDEGDDFYLQITTTKYMATKPLSKPKSIQLSHSLYNDEDFKICLFVKDNAIDSKLLEQIEEAEIPHLSKIITGKELKGEYKPYEAKRKLLSEYDLFLSDDYLVPTLPKLLGKTFYEHSSKFPIPIKAYSQNKFSIKTLTNSINKVLKSITYIPPFGVNLSLKIGNSDSEKSNLVANAQLIIENLKLQDGNKIRTIQLKTVDSPSLPLYYVEKLYSDEDVAENKAPKDKDDTESTTQLDASIEIPEGVKLTDFEKGLLELAADPQDVDKILSKKVKQAKKRKTVQEPVVEEEPKKKKGKK